MSGIKFKKYASKTRWHQIGVRISKVLMYMQKNGGLKMYPAYCEEEGHRIASAIFALILMMTMITKLRVVGRVHTS